VDDVVVDNNFSLSGQYIFKLVGDFISWRNMNSWESKSRPPGVAKDNRVLNTDVVWYLDEHTSWGAMGNLKIQKLNACWF
jgi:hypothetical protein